MASASCASSITARVFQRYSTDRESNSRSNPGELLRGNPSIASDPDMLLSDARLYAAAEIFTGQKIIQKHGNLR